VAMVSESASPMAQPVPLKAALLSVVVTAAVAVLEEGIKRAGKKLKKKLS